MPLFPELGRLTRLYVLDFGLFKVTKGERVIGIPGFLMETDAGKSILFDTGFPARYGDDAAAAAAEDGLTEFGTLLKMGREHLLTAQLALTGRKPRDIDLTILSHGHIDHVGGLDLVAHAPIVMTKRERAEPKPLYHVTARPMDWPEADYRLIDDDTEICDGLIVIPTPGHTPGHLSALLVLPETGPTVLTADAMSRPTEMMEGFPDAMDLDAARTSAGRLIQLATDAKAFVIWGHGPDQWRFLSRAPAFYS